MYRKAFFSIIVAALAITVTSCNKQKPDYNSEIDAAGDLAQAQQAFSELGDISDQGHKGAIATFKNGEAGGILSACATITFDTVTNPKRFTVDFGATNCLGNDGRMRRGKVIVEYQGTYRAPGSTWTIATDGYFVNDHELIGTHVVTNNGTNGNGNTEFEIDVDGHVVKPNGDTLDYTSDRIREWTAGESTFSVLDDEYLISGTATSISANGVSFTLTTLHDLLLAINCKHLKSGILELSSNSSNLTFELDYGNGTCDNKAVLTGPNGNTYNITLN